MGSPVNLASRLESNAEPGSILVSEATAALVRDRYALVPAAPMRLKGLPDGIGGYHVVLPADDETVVHDGPGATVRVQVDAVPPAARPALAKRLQDLAARMLAQ